MLGNVEQSCFDSGSACFELAVAVAALAAKIACLIASSLNRSIAFRSAWSQNLAQRGTSWPEAGSGTLLAAESSTEIATSAIDAQCS